MKQVMVANCLLQVHCDVCVVTMDAEYCCVLDICIWLIFWISTTKDSHINFVSTENFPSPDSKKKKIETISQNFVKCS